MPEQQVTISPDLPSNAVFIVESIAAAGGRPVLIGGAVRDRLLGLPAKDIDIEVYGLPMDALTEALQSVATVHAVGKSFGILKVNYRGFEIDVSLPRRERKAGPGHRGFAVQSDPFMPFNEAASRRDFTINAIGIDLIANELLDPWRGIDDLRHGIIRHITDAFDEDPLRVLRACQFAARFEFAIAPETLRKCRSLHGELEFLSRERIWDELKKLLLKSRRPSIGITALVDTDAIMLFPELAQAQELAGRNGWEAQNRILDNAARLCRDAQLPDDATLTLLLAALCLRFTTLAEPRHERNDKVGCDDRKEPSCDKSRTGYVAPSARVLAWFKDSGRQDVRDRLANPVSRGDEDIRQTTENFLQRSGCPLSFVKTAPPLAVHAKQPFDLWRQQRNAAVPDGVIRRLALQAPIRQLCLLAAALAEADPLYPQDAPTWLLAMATRLGVADAAPQPLLLGRHLQQLGLAPGLAYKKILDAAFEAQLDGQFANQEQGIAWLEHFLQR